MSTLLDLLFALSVVTSAVAVVLAVALVVVPPAETGGPGNPPRHR